MAAQSNQENNKYLLEIGTEELPVGFLMGAPGELKEKLAAALEEHGIGFGRMQTHATPRRIALIIEGLPEMQPERENLVKGPPIRVALDAEGQPTKAGEGFARKVGVSFSQLTREQIEGEEYVAYRQQIAGCAVREVLSNIVPDLVLGLSGSHFMTWGTYDIRFSRPIRWLVSIWNTEHLPLRIGPVESGTHSRGHRLLAKTNRVQIDSVDAYLSALEQDGAVMADVERRRDTIRKQLQATARELGGEAIIEADLLDTVTMLVEQPSVVAGSFKEEYLDIPEEVTTTVMAAHQKYFPVKQANGAMMPNFLAVANGRVEAADTIRRGNEKVITARLEDARFFYTEDQKIPLENYVEKLKGITFQKGLGSLYDKTMRISCLTGTVADMLGYDATGKQDAQRAARLAKADLVTGMVFEFTELQGMVGRKYALNAKEPVHIADAIAEHYLPRFAGDAVAAQPTGIAVSLADKLDTIMAVFSQQNAKLPTGSKDPLGLRRMASGVILTVLDNKLRFDIIKGLEEAYRNLGSLTQEPQDAAIERVSEFILQRFRVWLLEQNIRYDIIDAVLEGGQQSALRDLQDVLLRIEQLRALTQKPEQLTALYEPANRIARILGEQYDSTAELAQVDPARFKDEAEQSLYAAIQKVSQSADLATASYDAMIQALSGLADPVERFFDKVLINDPDPEVRKNRYNLLSFLYRYYMKLANFPKLVV